MVYYAFTVLSNEAERTAVAPEDWPEYLRQRDAILAYREGSK